MYEGVCPVVGCQDESRVSLEARGIRVLASGIHGKVFETVLKRFERRTVIRVSLNSRREREIDR